jgi:transketolase
LRKVFANEIERWIENDPNSVLLLGDIGVGSFSKAIKKFPDRVINLGILEQSMISFASGLVISGKKIIVHTIAPFMIARAYEQIKIDFGYRKLPGLFVSVGASFDYGKLGSTHHAPEDIALLATIPNVRVFIPGSELELSKMISLHKMDPRIDYVRLSQIGHSQNLDLILGINFLAIKQKRATVVAVGPMLDTAIRVADELDLSLIYVNTIDDSTKKIFELNTKPFFILEPYFSGTTLFAINATTNVKSQIYSFGIPHEFQSDYMESNLRLQLLGLDDKSILNKIKLIMLSET